jgi:hypothetical protein
MITRTALRATVVGRARGPDSNAERRNRKHVSRVNVVGTRINHSNAQRCQHHQKHKLLGLLVVKQPLTSSGEERRDEGSSNDL